MKSTSKLIVFIFTLLALTTSAYAQSPREQLNQMVQQLQLTPNDNALREKIIKLATTLRPLPAIPEQAREPFVMGATVLKKAGDPAGAGMAVDLFTQALNIAPWFADAYYNRAVARQAAGQFEPAIDDLKLYLGFKLTDSERREAQDNIYALKADAQLASSKKVEQAKEDAAKQGKINQEKAAEAAEATKFAWILGDWVVDDAAFIGPARSWGLRLVKSGNSIVNSGGDRKVRGNIQASGEIVWEQQRENPFLNTTQWFALRIDFTNDRRTATLYWPVPARDGSVNYHNEITSKMRRP